MILNTVLHDSDMPDRRAPRETAPRGEQADRNGTFAEKCAWMRQRQAEKRSQEARNRYWCPVPGCTHGPIAHRGGFLRHVEWCQRRSK